MDKDTLYRASTGDLATEGRTLTGLALPFNRPSLVRDPGRAPYLEAFAPTSADVSLRQARAPFPVFDWHDWKQGGLPVGATTFAKSSEGVIFRALMSDTQKADEALSLVSIGAMSDVSLGFRPLRQTLVRAATGDVTMRTEIALQELSLAPTGFGMYREARVLSVRARNDKLKSRIRRATLDGMTATLESEERRDSRQHDRERVLAGTLTRADYDRHWYGQDLLDTISRS